MEPSGRPPIRTVFRTQIVVLCLAIFLIDVLAGIVSATFSIFANDLGATVFVVGLLTSISGLTALFSSIPIGSLSDRIGHSRVMLGGMVAFTIVMVLFAVAPSPAFLIPGRMLMGVAGVGSFWIASAYLGDIVTPRERGIAFGLLTTSMGLGFGVGPVLGGQIADTIGMRWGFMIGAGFGLVAVALVRIYLWEPPRQKTALARPRLSFRDNLRVGTNRSLLAISVGSFVLSFSFDGAISTLFPLYGKELGLTTAVIGTMFAFRAVASSSVRLPGGALAGRIGSRKLVIVAILIEATAIAGIASTDSKQALTLWLMLEGLAFGIFLTSSQAYLAENTVAETRGSAIGFYSMVGGIGSTVAPLVLGLAGDLASIPTAFYIGSAFMLAGLAVMLLIWFPPAILRTHSWMNKPGTFPLSPD
jgi:MFS family permease